MRRFLFLICCIFSSGIALAQHSVDIGIFSNQPSDHYVFRVLKGRYQLVATNGTVYRFPQEATLHIERKNNAFEVRNDSIVIASFARPYFRAMDDYNTFFICDAEEKYRARQYDDDLSFQLFDDKTRLVNHVNIEKYVAGVVESEVGHFSDPDFLQAQSVIVRSYALRNKEKHFDEGLNLCDAVHCQAYKSRAYYTNALNIQHAVMTTKDLVLLDAKERIIDATFSSNCGGQTANSEDVWSAKIPYLRSIKDPHCQQSDHFHWEKELDKRTVEKYLGKKLKKRLVLNKSQKLFPGSKKKLTAFRSKFKLSSCDFEMIKKGKTLLLSGHGFGHGVGLCQEGAAAMGDRGFSFREILHFYYTNVLISTKE